MHYDSLYNRVGLILNADLLKPHSIRCLFNKVPLAKSMMLKCLFTLFIINCLISPAREFINLNSTIKRIWTLSQISFRLHYEFSTADICIKLAVCLSDICNIVSIFKFDLQLSYSNERVGDKTDKQAAFLSQSKS